MPSNTDNGPGNNKFLGNMETYVFKPICYHAVQSNYNGNNQLLIFAVYTNRLHSCLIYKADTDYCSVQQCIKYKIIHSVTLGAVLNRLTSPLLNLDMVPKTRGCISAINCIISLSMPISLSIKT